MMAGTNIMRKRRRKMAEFCYQCTQDHFGDGNKNDFQNMSKKSNTDKGLYASVLCEGCGYTQVNHDGMCIHHETDCLVAENEKS